MTGTGSFQSCSVMIQEAVGTNRNMGSSIPASGTLLDLEGRPGTSTGWPGGLCSPHPWRYSKASRHPSANGNLGKMTVRDLFLPGPFSDTL